MAVRILAKDLFTYTLLRQLRLPTHYLFPEVDVDGRDTVLL